jgi:hypothetical protein
LGLSKISWSLPPSGQGDVGCRLRVYGTRFKVQGSRVSGKQ